MRCPFWLSLSLAVLSLAAAVPAQSGRKVEKTAKAAPTVTAPETTVVVSGAQPADTIRIRTREVQIAVTVRDSLGQAVTDLQAADFVLYDNGKRYEPVAFEYRHTPVNVGVLLDESGNGFAERATVTQAVLSFAQQLVPTDRLAVWQFTDEVVLTSEGHRDAQALRKALRPALPANGKAALTDAISLAASQLTERPGRRVLLVLTSGLNTAGLTDFVQAAQVAQSAGVTVYVCSATEALAASLPTTQPTATRAAEAANVALARLQLARAEAELTYLAEASGGQIFFPLQARSLPWMLQSIARELRGQYWLSYVPDEEPSAEASLTDASSVLETHLLQVLVRGGQQAVLQAASRGVTVQPRLWRAPQVSASPAPREQQFSARWTAAPRRSGEKLPKHN